MRILKHHLHPAANVAKRAARGSADVDAVETVTEPESGSTSRIRQRTTVVLPLPDSPAMPSVSPGDETERHIVDRGHPLACECRTQSPSERRSRYVLAQVLHDQQRLWRRDGCDLVRSGSAMTRARQPSHFLTKGQAVKCLSATGSRLMLEFVTFGPGVRAARRKRAAAGKAERSGGWPGIVLRWSCGEPAESMSGIESTSPSV